MSALAQYAGKPDKGLIVAGDLNTGLWSPLYRRLMAHSALMEVRQGFGVLGTWPSFFGPWRTALDHILVSSGIEVIRTWVGPGIGSDHRPLLADLYVGGDDRTPE